MKKIIILSLTMTTVGLLNTIPASAITYQNNTDVDFTLNPTINLTLSGDSGTNLIIDNLAPGSASDSNIITATVSTNAGWGYYLSATVNTSTTNTNLTHETSNTNIFTSLNSNKPALSDFSDNTWGYSYCHNGSVDCSVTTNWVSGDAGSATTGYNGLPLDNNDSGSTGIKLLNPNSHASSGSVQFKIGAKASNTQAAGTYTGTVNFYAVTYRGPITFDESFTAAGKQKYLGYYKMQDMTTSICDNVHTPIASDNSDVLETKLIDIRDNNTYWVAKLKDGHCWMTQNLDLDLSTSTALTSSSTDLNQYGSNNYTSENGYSQSDGIITWIPERNTITTLNPTTWINDNSNPYSYDIGKTIVSDPNGSANGHRLNGNYYNWTASIASNDTSNFIESTYYIPVNNPKNSICPKNWRLPTMSKDENDEFQKLNVLYNNNSEDDAAGLMNAPLYLARSGNIYDNAHLVDGRYGYYQSSTIVNDEKTRRLGFASNQVSPSGSDKRSRGLSIRCIAR